jgi:hypothetical protein
MKTTIKTQSPFVTNFDKLEVVDTFKKACLALAGKRSLVGIDLCLEPKTKAVYGVYYVTTLASKRKTLISNSVISKVEVELLVLIQRHIKSKIFLTSFSAKKQELVRIADYKFNAEQKMYYLKVKKILKDKKVFSEVGVKKWYS